MSQRCPVAQLGVVSLAGVYSCLWRCSAMLSRGSAGCEFECVEAAVTVSVSIAVAPAAAAALPPSPTLSLAIIDRLLW